MGPRKRIVSQPTLSKAVVASKVVSKSEDVEDDNEDVGTDDDDDSEYETVVSFGKTIRIPKKREAPSADVPKSVSKLSKLDELLGKASSLPTVKSTSDSDNDNSSSSDSDNDEDDSDSDMEEISMSSAKTRALQVQQQQASRIAETQRVKNEAIAVKRQAIENSRTERQNIKKAKVEVEEETVDDDGFLSMDLLDEVENDQNDQFEEFMRKKRLGIIEKKSLETKKLTINDIIPQSKKPQRDLKKKQYQHGSVYAQVRPSAGITSRKMLLAQMSQESTSNQAEKDLQSMLYSTANKRVKSTTSLTLSGKSIGSSLADFATATSFKGKSVSNLVRHK